jgi:hypothetical protein
MGKPYGFCLEDLSKSNSEYYKYIKRKNKIYRRVDCISLQRQNMVQTACNCSTTFFMEYGENISYCNIPSDLDCLFNTAGVPDDSSDNGYDICPLECESFTYTYSLASSGPINPMHLKGVKQYLVSQNITNNNITDEELASSLAFVNIYYNHLGYTEIIEKPSYTTLSLISNVGGTLGLFMGLSLLSLFEFVEIFIILIENSLKNNNREIYPTSFK